LSKYQPERSSGRQARIPVATLTERGPKSVGGSPTPQNKDGSTVFDRKKNAPPVIKLEKAAKKLCDKNKDRKRGVLIPETCVEEDFSGALLWKGVRLFSLILMSSESSLL
jgi:hypothetical protein